MKPSERRKLTQIPADIAGVGDYERAAVDFIDPAIYEHIIGGSGDELTLRANRAAFEACAIHQRVFADCAEGSTRLSLLGRTFRHPIFLAPVAHQGLVHAEGERATARGAAAMDACLVASTLSSFDMETIAAETIAEKWFQLYFQPERAQTLALLRRAEKAGYAAIMVTADAPVQPLSRRASRVGFSSSSAAANLRGQTPSQAITIVADQSAVFQGVMARAPLWADLEWLVTETQLPVIVKGISHPDDAERCLAAGAAGIVASNHGGRALDGAGATLSALPALRTRLGRAACILLDGGVRSGADVFKAIAMGANAVLVGRPQIFALAVAGDLGVAHMLKLMRDELELCMALAGRPTIDCITRSALFGPTEGVA